ncbi:hypothetical protein [Sinomonas sp. ASV322]|uniref:hypothetical protein n=1 Tax=Sinomonas sp. ASV322 TaxID=3041920 RepID=UPI0027DE02C4|nr:hypothetical protein [Sinomonas sp. ASV322]MDQ4503843.1 hypothetical protein [Sinomonas sp. ASV322]
MRFTASTPATRVALAAALGVGLLAATGCGYINPQQTSIPYSPKDGIHANVGSIELRSVLIATTGKVGSGSAQTTSPDAPGRLIGSIFNTSSQNVSVVLSTPSSGSVRLDVPKNGTLHLEQSPNPVDFSHVGGIPGSLVDVKVTVDGKTQDVNIPVFDGTLEQYRPYLPTPTATPSSSSASASPSASATPSH